MRPQETRWRLAARHARGDQSEPAAAAPTTAAAACRDKPEASVALRHTTTALATTT